MRTLKQIPRMRVAVDIDETLTKGNAKWWDGNWGEPHEQAVEWVHQTYINGHTIMLYTARPERARGMTEGWLKDNGIEYHTLTMDKLSAQVYVDDRAIPASMIQRDEMKAIPELNEEIIEAFEE